MISISFNRYLFLLRNFFKLIWWDDIQKSIKMDDKEKIGQIPHQLCREVRKKN